MVSRIASLHALAGATIVLLGACRESTRPTAPRLSASATLDGVSAGPALMIPPDAAPRIRDAAARGTPAWKALKRNVDGPGDRTSAMNLAVAYLATNDRRYCDRLSANARSVMANANPRGDSYYGYASIMESLAIPLVSCGALLDPTLHRELSTYLDTWTDELWFHNRGTGWGLKDPGNNYHISFLLGTTWAGLALRATGHPNASRYLDVVATGVEEELAFLRERCEGGGWAEGTNYGEGSKGRLADLFSLLAAAGARNAFRESDFFSAALRYAHYQLQPGNEFLYPAGDMARESDMRANSYDRQYMQQIVYWSRDSEARAVGQWYLQHVVPNYQTGFDHSHALWRDVVYGLDLPSRPQSALPLSYWAKGDGFLSMRSAWTRDATALMVSGASNLDQSHAHLDTGGFTLWRQGWQLVDAVTFSHSGLLQDPGAHNLVDVPGARKLFVKPRGVLRFADAPETSYVQIDATGMYMQKRPNLLLRELTREIVYLKPDTVVLYDRVEPAAPAQPFSWRVHFPSRPSRSGATLQSLHGGGGVTVALVVGDAPQVVPDTDLAPDGSKSWRAEATTTTGRFLAVARTGAGAAPPLPASAVAATGAMEGVLLEKDVVLFSKLGAGRSVELPFRYTVPTAAGRVHTLLNMTGPVTVGFRQEGGSTVVTVARGSDLTPTPEGVLRFTESPPR